MQYDRLILPPAIRPVVKHKGIIFLAGPITSAPNWHAEAINYLLTHTTDVYVASPRRLAEPADSSSNILTVEQCLNFTPDMFADQIDWETYYLNLAAQTGLILFWLPCQAEQHPERAYGQTTRFELGEWYTKLKHLPQRLVLGIEPNFPGGKYIQYRIEHENPHFTIHTTLQATLDAALSAISNGRMGV